MNDRADGLTMLAGLRAHATHRARAWALSDDRGRYTFGELWHASTLVAHRLRSEGVRTGDPVGVAVGGSAANVASVLGAMLAGAAAAPLNTALTSPEVSRYLEILGPTAVLADPEGVALLPPGVRVVEVDTDASVTALPARLGVDERGEAGTVGLGLPGGSPALLFPTGGTTGLPKAAVISHQATLLWAMSMAGHGRAGSGVELCFLPFFHVGLLTGLLSTLHAGGPAIIQARFDPERACDHIVRDGASRLQVVPTHMRRLREVAAFEEARPRIRDVRFGGMASDPEFVDELLDLLPNAQLSTSYGATEFGPVTHLGHAELLAGCRSGVGRPVPGVSISIQPTDDERPGPGVPGDVVVRCPWSASGYVGRAEETAATFTPEGVRLADVGALDDDGRLTLLGRRSDMVVTGGENVFPTEIEAVLATHPDVAEVVVFGVPDPIWGERVEAAIVTRDSASPTLEGLREFARGRLAPYKLPRSVRVLDRIPLTPNNKPDRRALRAASDGRREPTPVVTN